MSLYSMQRRRFLQLLGVCGTTALAGCISDDSPGATAATEPKTGTGTESPSEDDTDNEDGQGDGGGTTSLVTPIDRLWDAYNERDVTGMQAVFHPESSIRPTEEEVSFEGEVTVSSTTVLERTDESATVEAALVYETDSDRSERTDTYELRRYEGRWVIWSRSVRGGDGADEPVPPQIAFEFDYDAAAADSSDTGVLTITHSAGDNVDAATLSVGGSGIVALDGIDTDITAPDTNWSDATGIEEVSAGRSITVGVRSDCRVSVIWTVPDGDESTVLAEYDGPDA